MLAFVQFTIFAGAMAAGIVVIATSLAAEWSRIVAVLTGRPRPVFSPLRRLAVAERRIAVRRWAARPVPVAINRLRAAV